MVPMVSISSRTTTGPPAPRLVAYAAALAFGLALTGAYLWSSGDAGGAAPAGGGAAISPRTALTGLATAAGRDGGGDARTGDPLKNREELDAEDVDPLRITEGVAGALGYYHCGPLPSADNPDLTELVLLHGAAFTKEEWRSSGILDLLCEINNEEDEGNLSVTALDLPVAATGPELAAAFDALAARGAWSGRAATVVSPSASGKALVGLGELAADGGDGAELSRLVRAWIPVASFAVLGATDAALRAYKAAGIPVLAVHGDQDKRGAQVTARLTELIEATGLELEGRHPVYLDAPEEFVSEVLQFLDREGF